MRDAQTPRNEGVGLNSLQAFLYANGELNEEETTEFEKRLGEDQSAREALCQAVQLTLTLRQHAPLTPSPVYRERVRERLRRGSRWSWLIGRRTYRGHPAIWSAVGAAAAVLLVMGLAQLPSMLNQQPHPPLPAPPVQGVEEEGGPGPIAEPPQVAANEDIANIWATLNSTQHVAKAHDEEMRRKSRIDDRLRSVRPADPRPRPNKAPTP